MAYICLNFAKLLGISLHQGVLRYIVFSIFCIITDQYRAIASFKATNPGEISFEENSILTIIEKTDRGNVSVRLIVVNS